MEATALTAVLTAAAVALPAGAVAGAGARVLLRRLRRGARVQPPWCELSVASTWAGAAAAWAAGWLPVAWLPVVLGLGWFAVAAGAVDVAHRRLPDALTLPALPVALLLLVPLGPPAVARGAAGAVLAALVHAAVHLADRRALGAGDVKLAAPLGAVLAAVAWPALVLGAVVAAVLTAVVAVASAPRHRWRGRAVSHGPSMLAATWMVTVGLVAVGAAGGGGGG